MLSSLVHEQQGSATLLSLPLRLPWQLNYQPNLLTHQSDKPTKKGLPTNSSLGFPVQQLNTSWVLSATTGAFTGPCHCEDSQLVISTVPATGQDLTVLIPDEVTLTLGYQSLLPTEFHTYSTLSPIYGATETVPQLGGNFSRNSKELPPSLTFIGWSCILVILEGSTTGLGRLSVSRIFCH